jgi:hypothetical protein
MRGLSTGPEHVPPEEAEPGESAVMTANRSTNPPDWPVGLQNGVLTRSQALASGITDKVIAAQIKRGRWQRMHRGVYATFSGTPSRDCLLWAAVLRAGPRAVLSHQTAARLWGLPSGESSAIHVSVPIGSPAPRIRGVIVHYSSRGSQARHPALAPPRTTIEATVLDLASMAPSAEDAIAQVLGAIASRRTTAERVVAVLRRRGRMRWRSAIRLALDPMNSGVHSILEYRFVTRVERPHGLPAGVRQRPVVRGHRKQYSDVAYDGYATLVELDGRAAHPDGSRQADAWRDNANIADGRVTLRYGWTDVNERGCEIAAQIAITLRGRGWPGWPRRCGPACRIPPSLLAQRPASGRAAGASGRASAASGRASAASGRASAASGRAATPSGGAAATPSGGAAATPSGRAATPSGGRQLPPVGRPVPGRAVAPSGPGRSHPRGGAFRGDGP